MNSPYASGIKDHKDICYHTILWNDKINLYLIQKRRKRFLLLVLG